MNEEERAEIVSEIKKLLSSNPIKIDLDTFIITVKPNSEYRIGTHIGFKFHCQNSEGLKKALLLSQEFNLDSTSTALGWFMQLATHGVGFRQIGRARSLHIEIDDHACDIHVDTHGIVEGLGVYYFRGMEGHLNWDLIPSFLPSLHLGRTSFLNLYAGITDSLSEESVLEGLTTHGPVLPKLSKATLDLLSRAEVGVQLYIGESTGFRTTVSGLGDRAKIWGSFETRVGSEATLRMSATSNEFKLTIGGYW